jgi:hypothetical protein
MKSTRLVRRFMAHAHHEVIRYPHDLAMKSGQHESSRNEGIHEAIDDFR